MSKSKLGNAVSNTVFTSLLSTLPPAFAEKFSLDQEDVKSFLSEYLTSTLKTPKRSGGPNGYVSFASANRKLIQEELESSGTLKGLTKKEIFSVVGKEVGARWRVLSEGEKNEWTAKAQNKTVEQVLTSGSKVQKPKKVKAKEPSPPPEKPKKQLKKVRKATAKESDDEASH